MGFDKLWFNFFFDNFVVVKKSELDIYILMWKDGYDL